MFIILNLLVLFVYTKNIIDIGIVLLNNNIYTYILMS